MSPKKIDWQNISSVFFLYFTTTENKLNQIIDKQKKKQKISPPKNAKNFSFFQLLQESDEQES